MADIARRALGGLFLAAPALAQPARPIVIIVPFPPGGSTDVTARLLAERMAPLLGQPVLTENRPGAQTIIGAEYVARSAPDALTLLMSSGTTLTINPLIGRNLPYRVEDFAPVAHVATLPFAIAVRNGLPSGMAEFVAHIRANPGRINWGHNGRGSFNHIAGALIEERLGLRWQDVPYRGDAPQLNDVLAGTLDAMLVGGASAIAGERTGRARIVAWTGERRLPNRPTEPCFEEAWPGTVAVTWFGLLAPARSPAAQIERLNAAAAAALVDPLLQDRLLAEGILSAGGSVGEFSNFLQRERDRWAPLLRRLDIQLG
ncbi:tripartite tricarboxylate transporter substrate binding protein [Plastoroseomonas arctica]|uniref:Tripartite tricarboxylate transporter substrate binding protein n=1 Tax=Plastoroseomonas arctica TaxID=1509237 RepID=A0AAF1JXF5_9PROT|nr:tripartite tricarboxylate transporter substrate binding protein [Plastoroseomonas arctica]MBR0653754.1 tripartite tricarboxylate transporter substrate binding protein [Plastoroseomonas arctica]